MQGRTKKEKTRPGTEQANRSKFFQRHNGTLIEALSLIYLLLIAIATFFLSATFNEHIGYVIMLFSPAIATIVMGMIIHHVKRGDKRILWIVALFLIFTLHRVIEGTIMHDHGLQCEITTGLNIILTFTYLIILCVIFPRKKCGCSAGKKKA